MLSNQKDWLINRSRISQAVIGSFIKLILTFWTVRLVANTIGSEEYGRQMFLIAVSQSLKPLIDLGMSSSFFTMISQQPGNKKITIQYFSFVIIMWFLVVISVLLLHKTRIVNLIWLNNKVVDIILVFTLVYFTEIVWLGITRVAEALKLAIFSQSVGIAASFVCLVISLFLGRVGSLNTVTYVLAVLTIWFLASALTGRILYIKILATPFVGEKNISLDTSAKMWIARSKPLFIFSIYQAATIYVDRWALQKFYGSSEQAKFALALQMSTAVIFATSAAVEVLWRDTAEAVEKANSDTLKITYNFYLSRFLFLTSVVCAGVIAWGEKLFELLFNKEYGESVVMLYVLSVYSCYLSWSQVSGVWFYATNKTLRYVIIYIIVNLIGTLSFGLLIVFYSESNSLTGLGGTVLSLKMLATQFAIGNLQYYFICKKNSWFWDWAIQVKIIGGPIIIASVIKLLFKYIFQDYSYLSVSVEIFLFVLLLFIIGNRTFFWGVFLEKLWRPFRPNN